MKKVITFITLLLASTAIFAQGSIDTAKQTVTMKLRDLLYFSSYMADAKDSANQRERRRIEAKLKTYSNLNANTVVTVDTVRGEWIVRFLEVRKFAPAGEIELVAPASLTNLTTITNSAIAYQWGIIVGRAQQGYTQHATTGKDMYFDNLNQ